MKLSSLKNFVLFQIAFLPYATFAAAPSAEHVALTQSIDKAIEWSQHVKTEVAKGKKLSKPHATQELSGLRNALDEMSKYYLALSKQPAAEVTEGHFVAIKTHQVKAQGALETIEMELLRSVPKISTMKKAARTIEAELKKSAKEHAAELSELEGK
jgi:hypothetical protein